MEAVLITIHLIITIALAATILLQPSEGGALGIGGGPAGLMSSRGAANFLNKTTRWLAFFFIVNALALGWLSANRDDGLSILDAAEKNKGKEENPLPELPVIPD